MKRIILTASIGLFGCIAFLYFYLFGFPSFPTSTPSEIKLLMTESLHDAYTVSSVTSISRTLDFEGEIRRTKWLTVTLDHKPITDGEEMYTIAEKVCKIILKFNYEGVYIRPSTGIPNGANCGIWGP